MNDTMTRYLAGIMNSRVAGALRVPLSALADRMSSQPLTSAGLVIKAGGGVLAKTGAGVFYATAGGVLVSIAAATDMPALTGITIAANQFNAVCFFVDSASVVTVAAGTSGAAIGGIAWPQFPAKKALVGFLIITHSATFTGNTTALDTATTVYVSPLGPWDPTMLV